MRYARTLFAVVASNAGLATCSVGLDLPDKALVRCARNNECPTGSFCNLETGRCVRDGTSDLEAPAVVPPITVSPTVGNATAVFTVSFFVSEELAAPPQLFVDGFETELAFEAQASDPSARRFVYSYTPDGTEAEGANPLTISMRDTFGNLARGALGASLVFDFTAPQVLSGSESVTMVPGADNPLLRVSKARAGTTVNVGFSVTEPLAQDSTPALRSTAPAEMIFDLLTTSGTALLFARTLQATPVEGTYTLEAWLRDVAGNEAWRPVVFTGTGLEVDTTAPLTPDVDAADRIVHRRTPWGRAATDGQPFFVVEGAPGALAEEGTVLVHASASAPRIELGRGGSDGLGGFEPIPLIAVDVARVWVSLVDQAGNESVAAAVRDVEWTATLGFKTPGDSSNPLVFERRRVFNGAIQQSEYVSEGGAPQGLARLGDDTSDELVSIWEKDLEPGTLPGLSYGFGLAFDRARGRAVLWGEDTESIVYEWDGQRWESVVPADPETDGNPRPRDGTNLVYDPGAGRTLMFGGTATGCSTTGNTCADLWAWDGNSWELLHKWSESAPDASPAPRSYFAMTYDALRRRTLVFGGQGASGEFLGDTWAWDGAAWTLVCGGSAPACGPSPRRELSMVFDPSRGVTVMYGGILTPGDLSCTNISNGVCGDTWELNGSVWTEKLVTEPGSTGYPLRNPALAYDPHSQTVVLFGGRLHPSNDCGSPRAIPLLAYLCDELWSWDGGQWRPVLEPLFNHSHPGPRSHARAVADGQGAVLLVGGEGASTSGMRPDWQDSWTWDGAAWTEHSRYAPPGGVTLAEDDRLASHSAVYDINRSQLQTFSAYQYFDAPGLMWLRHAGGGWRVSCDPLVEVCPASCIGPAEAPCGYSWRTAYHDPGRGLTVLFSGIGEEQGFSDQWWFDGSGWQDVSPIGIEGVDYPLGRYQSAIAFDDRRGLALLFGGLSFDFGAQDDTWIYDGTTWSDVSPVGTSGVDVPTPRYGHALVYDSGRDRVLLLGGTDNLYPDYGECDYPTYLDMWEWRFDEAAWRRLVSQVPDGLGFQAAAAYHPRTGDVYLVGGCGPNGRSDRTYRFDGTTWTDVSPIDYTGDQTPKPRVNAELVFAETDGRVHLIGGDIDAVFPHNLWRLRDEIGQRPAHVLKVPLAASKAASPTLAGVSVTWLAAAAGNGWDLERRTVRLHDRGSTGGADLVRTYDTETDPAVDLSTLYGQTQNRVWRLFLRNASATAPGVLNGWCVIPQGKAPQCRSPNLPLPGGRVVSDAMDLSVADLPLASDVNVSVDVSHADPTQLVIDLVAAPGRQGSQPGVQLLLWYEGGWRAVDKHATEPSTAPGSDLEDSPWRLAWNADAADLPRAFVGTSPTLTIAAVPEGTGGGARTRIASDYVEVTVRYREQ